jgi:hypothetical protein
VLEVEHLAAVHVGEEVVDGEEVAVEAGVGPADLEPRAMSP